MIRTSFTDLVGCQVPIQQAPMGAISGSRLALAVAAAGGVGTLRADIGESPDALAARLDEVAAADGVFAVNFITDQIDHAAVAAAASRMRIVDFFWQQPDRALADVAHEGGALVSWQVGSLPDAVAAAEAGADVISVQGTEAGGHVRGESPLLPLLVSVLRAVDVPVLAAGGIADPRTFAAVLAAGAAGARIGTRFLATEESGAHPEYVLAVLAAGPDSTEITDGFAVCPMCATLPRARVLRSAIEAVDKIDGDTVGVLVAGEMETPVPVRAGMPPHRDVRGEIHAMALYAGQSAHLITSVEPAGAIVGELAGGAEELLRAW